MAAPWGVVGELSVLVAAAPALFGGGRRVGLPVAAGLAAVALPGPGRSSRRPRGPWPPASPTPPFPLIPSTAARAGLPVRP